MLTIKIAVFVGLLILGFWCLLGTWFKCPDCKRWQVRRDGLRGWRYRKCYACGSLFRPNGIQYGWDPVKKK
jgi:hypothetical protein